MATRVIQYSSPDEIDADHYEFRVRWSPEDGEYLATTAEWGPGLSWLDSTPEAALEGLRGLVSEAIADLQAQRAPVPSPLSDRSYSGRLLLRMSPRLHARLARQAAEADVSLNQLVLRRLEPEEARG